VSNAGFEGRSQRGSSAAPQIDLCDDGVEMEQKKTSSSRARMMDNIEVKISWYSGEGRSKPATLAFFLKEERVSNTEILTFGSPTLRQLQIGPAPKYWYNRSILMCKFKVCISVEFFCAI